MFRIRYMERGTWNTLGHIGQLELGIVAGQVEAGHVAVVSGRREGRRGQVLQPGELAVVTLVGRDRHRIGLEARRQEVGDGKHAGQIREVLGLPGALVRA